MSLSLAEEYALASEEEQAALAAEFFPTDEALAALRYNREFWGRPEQIWLPGPERTTAFIGGRGTGKTQTAGWAANYVGMHPELCGGRVARGPDDYRAGDGAHMGIVGRTANDRNQTLIDGDSGIMATCDPALRPEWRKSDGLLVWPTGVRGRLISGQEPDSARGPNLGFALLDELPHYQYAEEVWKQINYSLRKSSPGHHPRCLVTTTPLGTTLMISIVFKLGPDGMPIKAPSGTPATERVMAADGCWYMRNPRTRVITGSSYDNVANLSADFLSGTLGELEGTQDADQEIRGLIRLGAPGALWHQDWFQRCEAEDVPQLDRILVAIDPTVSDGVKVRGSQQICEAGIIGMGLDARRRKVYALADRSCTAMPSVWADRAVALAAEIGAHEIWAEDNQGGEMVRDQVNAAWTRSRTAWEAMGYRRPKVNLGTAHRSKLDRFANAAPAWEAGKVVHVGPARVWTSLERQQTQYDPNRPHDRQQCDRVDAAVWGIIQLLGDGTDRARVQALTDSEGMARVLAAMRARRGR